MSTKARLDGGEYNGYVTLIRAGQSRITLVTKQKPKYTDESRDPVPIRSTDQIEYRRIGKLDPNGFPIFRCPPPGYVWANDLSITHSTEIKELKP